MAEISTSFSVSGPTVAGVDSTVSGSGNTGALCYGVMDRIHRASSGKTLALRIHVS